MTKQTVQEIWNNSPARQRVATEDARPEHQTWDDGWRDPMRPLPPEDFDENGEPLEPHIPDSPSGPGHLAHHGVTAR